MRFLASTKDMARDEWLRLRQRSIGGSEAAVVLGLNPYKSPFTLYHDKKGLLSDVPDNEKMRIGRDLEQYVAERFCEATGKKVRRKNAMYMHDDFDFITANVDREIVGENAGLECKTTSMFSKFDFKNGEVPKTYYCQCMHYMAVMGYDKMYLAILVLGVSFYHFEILRDEAEIEALVAAERSFWENYILTDTPPDVDGTESTSDTLSELYPTANGESIVLYGTEELVKSYQQAKQKEKEFKELGDKYKNQLAELLGDAEKADLNGFVITYKNQTRISLDTKKLKEEKPEIFADYAKTTTSRVLKVKEVKE